MKKGRKYSLQAVLWNLSLSILRIESNAKAIGTPIEIVNGRVRVVGELAANERKIEQVLWRLGVKRVDVAYGDTVLDIPLLEHAEHPIAVYPDKLLMEAAIKRGWEILGAER